jgi:hypothetical protein
MTNFEDGFYGDSFREFDRLGVKTVRHLFETNKLPNEIEHNAAEKWLGLQDAKERFKEQYRFLIPVTIGALTLSIVVANFVVNVSR